MFTEPGQFFVSSAASYEIEQSCRFNDGDSPYLNRSFVTPTSAANFGYSFWVKLGAGYNGSYIISADGSGNNDNFYFNSNQINIQEGGVPRLVSNQVFRDHAAWYHFVVAYELGNSTNAHKLRVYLNGSEITSWSTDARSGFASTSSRLNANGVSHDIGANANNGASTHVNNFDGYLSEFHFVDGTVLTPSMFGEYNDEGIWIPKKASPTYGNNGFYLAFQDSSALGDDTSGEGHDFSSSGLAAADQVTDSPTNNFATWNPIIPLANGSFSDGNLEFTQSGGSISQHAKSTISFTSGEKKVCEMQTVSGASITLGICDEDFVANANGFSGDSRGYFDTNGNKVDKDGNSSSYGASFGTSNVIRIEVDLSNNPGTIEFFKDGVSQGDAFTDIDSTKTWFFWCRCKADAVKANFGQLGFAGTPTANFTALNTANLPSPSIIDPSVYFQTTLYTGTGSSRSVDQSGNSKFQPDWVWVKSRGTGADHALYDVLRGVQKELKTNATDAEATVTTGLTAFESDGFQVGSRVGMNGSSDTFVAWQWLANGSGSSNTDGSINTTATSANTTAGFSINTYTGTGSNATVGHGLGVAPSMIILHRRNGTGSWRVYNKNLTDASYVLNMESTGAQEVSATVWNSTDPTSTVFSIGTNAEVNASGGTYVAYCFAEIEGYSKFGSYEGNGNADGSFVYTGFQPAYLFLKNIDAAESYNLRDNKRDPFNVTKQILFSNTNAAESTSGGGQFADLLSNGFKLRGTDPGVNSSATFIYMAFAENPFGGSGLAPTTAR